MPADVPGAAVSPGTSSCIFVNAPDTTTAAEPVFGDFVPSVTSLAATVWLPAVLQVIVNARVPDDNPAFAGRVAFRSLEVI